MGGLPEPKLFSTDELAGLARQVCHRIEGPNSLPVCGPPIAGSWGSSTISPRPTIHSQTEWWSDSTVNCRRPYCKADSDWGDVDKAFAVGFAGAMCRSQGGPHSLLRGVVIWDTPHTPLGVAQ
jgi:hypothetical protein